MGSRGWAGVPRWRWRTAGYRKRISQIITMTKYELGESELLGVLLGVRAKDETLADLAVSKGAKLDRPCRQSFISKYGHTPLHLAIFSTFPDAARTLIKGGTSNLEDIGRGFSKINNFDARGGQAEWQQVI